MEELTSVIRSVLLSSKNGIRMQDLNRDYQMIEGESIPYRACGFKSLDELFSKVPGIKVYKRGADTLVEAIPTEESAHITKMIRSQKVTTKRKSRNVQRNRYPPKMSAYRPPSNSNNYSNRNAPPRNMTRNQPIRPIETPRISKPIPPLMTTPLKPTAAQTTTNNTYSPKLTNGTVQNRIAPNEKSVHFAPDTPVKFNTSGQGHRLAITPKQTPPEPTPSPRKQSTPLVSTPTYAKTVSNNLPAISNLSLNGHPPSPQKIQSVTIPTNPVQSLERLVAMKGLEEPQYITKVNNRKIIYAQVEIGLRKYSSYPHETKDKEVAKQMAAEFAFEALHKEFDNAKNLLPTKNRSVVEQRILKIVKAHPHGVVMQGVVTYYTEEYSELLPEDWLEIVEGHILLEKGASNSTILLMKKDAVMRPMEEEVTSPRPDSKITLCPMGIPEPGALKLPEDEYWVVYIMTASSTTEIWANIVGDDYSEKLQTLAEDMSVYYTSNGVPATSITVGRYYALYEDDSWHRVRCVHYDEKIQEVCVFFIDRGENDLFSASRLSRLENQFMYLPAQAVRLAVRGLEAFADCVEVQPILDSLLGDVILHGKVVKKAEDKHGPYVSMHFYCSGEPEDVLLDDVLISEILLNIVDVPVLEENKGAVPVYCSEVGENGELYVQIVVKSLEYLAKLMDNFIENYSDEELRKLVVPVVNLGKLYLVKSPEDGKFYRGKATSAGQNFFHVFLVDVGRTVIVGKSSVFKFDDDFDILVKYPAQAVKVQLHKISPLLFDETMKSQLAKLAPPTQDLLMKVVGINDTRPVVELFKRVQPENLIISINDTIIYTPKNNPKDDANNNVSSGIKPRRKLNQSVSRFGIVPESTGKVLDPPKIPPVGAYFDVHVTMAANPSNFTVQPHEDIDKLSEMMARLQVACSAYSGPALQTDTLLSGSLYAGKYDDGSWYRVCLSNVLYESLVSVYFCDFGDYAVLNINNMQPLKNEFRERPYEAIKAKLAGISPVNGDWSVQDCVRFHELVVDRNFVSLIVENSLDKMSPGDTILGVNLIDTSTEKDVDIAQILVNEGRAYYTNSSGDETNNNRQL